MNNLKTPKAYPLIQRIASFCLTVVLMLGIALSYGHAAQAAVDTTSSATKADANRINQRKENAPHYPNWYEDQRSLESYMDRADVSRRGDSPTDQNNDDGYNPIRQDRVNGYNQDEDRSSSLIDRSRERLGNAADNIRETLSSNSRSSSDYDRSYARSQGSADDVKDRAGNRIEQAKEVFQGATERTAKGSNPTITGKSNR